MSCKFPFSFIEVFSNGDVYPCCPEYCYYYCLGNIFEQSLEEIWYGSKATALRKRLLSDDHTVCNAMQCFRETMDFLLPEDDIVWMKNRRFPLPLSSAMIRNAIAPASHAGICPYGLRSRNLMS